MGVSITKSILTLNPCYTTNKTITVKGLMLHSVGCPQPNASVFIKKWNSTSYNSACVHGFIDGNTGKIYQTLPWNHRGWHCGKGTNGSANNTHIGVEMCEPACIKYTSGSKFECYNKTEAVAVAKRTYASAVSLFAYLCELYKLDPLKSGVIISHEEGNKLGIASPHGDPAHLWKQLGMTSYTMDNFRKAVKAEMIKNKEPKSILVGATNEEKIWNFLQSKINNAYGTAGLMGNLYAESGLSPINLKNTYNTKLGYTDQQYTDLVDNNKYTNFIKDSAGYGLLQWTYWSRKQALYNYIKNNNYSSIGSLQGQLEFLMKEISESYPSVLSALKKATSVQEASDVALVKFVKMSEQEASVKNKRCGYGVTYYNKYKPVTAGAVTSTTTTNTTTNTTTSTSSGTSLGVTIEAVPGPSPSQNTTTNNTTTTNKVVTNTSTTTTRKKYKVLVGKYSLKINATLTYNKLKKAGFTGYVTRDGKYYCVQVGVFNNLTNANALKTKLSNKKFSARVQA